MSYFELDGQSFEAYEYVHLLRLKYVVEDVIVTEDDKSPFDIARYYKGDTRPVNKISIEIGKKPTSEAFEVEGVIPYMRKLFNHVPIGIGVDTKGTSNTDDHISGYSIEENPTCRTIIPHIVRQSSLIASSTRRSCANNLMMNKTTAKQIERLADGAYTFGDKLLANSIKVIINEELEDGELFLVYVGNKMDVPFLYHVYEDGTVRVIENDNPKTYGVRLFVVE